MKIAAFIQAYNELSKGHLIRCLENVKIWADEIFIYDDCSTDGSQEVYKLYTPTENIIFGKERSFKNEQFNKQKLLNLTLSKNPDWIFWIDVDTIADRVLTYNLRDILREADSINVDGVICHNYNLWRSDCFVRMDDSFDSCNPLCIWKNNGNLKYDAKSGLHGQLFPNGMNRIIQTNYNLLHYGFASEEWIINKYNMYKNEGQSGWALDRLITEGAEFSVKKLPKDIYPPENIPVNYDMVKIPERKNKLV